jgi:putative mycofactocin binding protein MftB
VKANTYKTGFGLLHAKKMEDLSMDREIEKKDVQLEDMECEEAPRILEEITMEEMAVDGICGIY